MHEAGTNPYAAPRHAAAVEGGRALAGFKPPGTVAVLAVLTMVLHTLPAWGIFVISRVVDPGFRKWYAVQAAASWPLYLLAIVLYLIWTHRVTANAGLLDGAKPRHGPGMAVASYFIPLVNLVLPCTILLEVFDRTFKALGRRAPRWLVVAWWSLFLVSQLNMYRFWPPQVYFAIAMVRLVALGLLIAMMATLCRAQSQAAEALDDPVAG